MALSPDAAFITNHKDRLGQRLHQRAEISIGAFFAGQIVILEQQIILNLIQRGDVYAIEKAWIVAGIEAVAAKQLSGGMNLYRKVAHQFCQAANAKIDVGAKDF